MRARYLTRAYSKRNSSRVLSDGIVANVDSSDMAAVDRCSESGEYVGKNQEQIIITSLYIKSISFRFAQFVV